MSGGTVKLLRTIRFDQSDQVVFDVAAEEGEWAVSGAFAFADGDPSLFKGKIKQAFANGFLGVASFGRSTFAVVAAAKQEDRDEIVFRLAQHFIAHYGAPDLEAAWAAAEDEVAFAQGLANDQPINTVLTVRRLHDATGVIKEEFRTIRPPTGEPLHARIWTVESDET